MGTAKSGQLFTCATNAELVPMAVVLGRLAASRRQTSPQDVMMAAQMPAAEWYAEIGTEAPNSASAGYGCAGVKN